MRVLKGLHIDVCVVACRDPPKTTAPALFPEKPALCASGPSESSPPSCWRARTQTEPRTLGARNLCIPYLEIRSSQIQNWRFLRKKQRYPADPLGTIGGMGASSSRNLLKIDHEHRIAIPFEYLDWVARYEGRRASFLLFPRIWVSGLGLRDDLASGVWALGDFNADNAHVPDVSNWFVDPSTLVQPTTNPESDLLTHIVFERPIGPKNSKRTRSAWHLTIPMELRGAGYLPSAGNNIWLFWESHYRILSIWRTDSWASFFVTPNSF